MLRMLIQVKGLLCLILIMKCGPSNAASNRYSVRPEQRDGLRVAATAHGHKSAELEENDLGGFTELKPQADEHVEFNLRDDGCQHFPLTKERKHRRVKPSSIQPSAMDRNKHYSSAQYKLNNPPGKERISPYLQTCFPDTKERKYKHSVKPSSIQPSAAQRYKHYHSVKAKLNNPHGKKLSSSCLGPCFPLTKERKHKRSLEPSSIQASAAERNKHYSSVQYKLNNPPGKERISPYLPPHCPLTKEMKHKQAVKLCSIRASQAEHYKQYHNAKDKLNNPPGEKLILPCIQPCFVLTKESKRKRSVKPRSIGLHPSAATRYRHYRSVKDKLNGLHWKKRSSSCLQPCFVTTKESKRKRTMKPSSIQTSVEARYKRYHSDKDKLNNPQKKECSRPCISRACDPVKKQCDNARVDCSCHPAVVAANKEVENCIKEQIRDAEAALLDETSNMQVVVQAVCVANQAVAEAECSVQMACESMCQAKKLVEETTSVAKAVAQVRDDKQDLIEAAKKQIELLMCQLKKARQCTQSALKAKQSSLSGSSVC